jgi:hypothetical protein
MKTVLISAALLVVAVIALQAVGQAAPKPVRPKPPINDGLPTSWFGRTTSTLKTDNQSAETSARVTFKLAEKHASKLGTLYVYRPSAGTIRVAWKDVNPGCTVTAGPADFKLEPVDAVLDMWVAKPGKRPPTAYDGANGGNRQIVTETTDCPSTGTHVQDTTILPAWINFPPRPFKTTASKLEGSHDNGGGFTFEWCFARRAFGCPEE